MTKSKIFILFFAFFFFISLTFVSAGTYHGSFTVDVDSGTINIGTVCEEDWSDSYWTSCVDGEQTFVCFDKNNCGTEDMKPADCGTTRQCNETSEDDDDDDDNDDNNENTGGGSTGGSTGGSNSGTGMQTLSSGNTETNLETSSCTEEWECDAWSNSEDKCGLRVCRDINECGTTDYKPKTEKDCPNIGIFGVTGAVIGGFTNFAKSKTGIGLIFALLLVVLGILILSSKKPKRKIVTKKLDKKPTGNNTKATTNNTEQKTEKTSNT